MPGLVPLYDEMAACRFAGYRFWHEWQDLSPQERARLVAYYYLDALVEGHKEDAAIEYSRRQSKRK